MPRSSSKKLRPEYFRKVPGYEDIYAIEVMCFGDCKCTKCGHAIEKGKRMWFCDGVFLKNGLDGRWHEKCL
jgi:hypothetical protein